MREEGLLTTTPLDDDVQYEAGLRPRRLDEFVGQDDLKERLTILVDAARSRAESVDHVLFSGPPGLGKTSLAGILAAEMGAAFRATSGPALERPGDLAAVLTNLDHGDVLFIDEVHRLPRQVEEVLYPAMEDFELDIIVGKGPAARSIRLELPRFTLVGATTRVGRVAPPLRDRFGYVARLDYYADGDLAKIITRSAGILEVDVTAGGATLIATRSRGTPRIANRLLRRGAGFRGGASRRGHRRRRGAGGAQAVGGRRPGASTRWTGSSSTRSSTSSGAARSGCRRWRSPSGRSPRRWKTPTSRTCSQEGLLMRTPRGRVATPHAYAHLGITPPDPGGHPTLL